MSGKLDLAGSSGLGGQLGGQLTPGLQNNALRLMSGQGDTGYQPMARTLMSGTGPQSSMPWGGLYSGFGSTGMGAGAPGNSMIKTMGSMGSNPFMSGNYGPVPGAGRGSFRFSYPNFSQGQGQNPLLRFTYPGGNL